MSIALSFCTLEPLNAFRKQRIPSNIQFRPPTPLKSSCLFMLWMRSQCCCRKQGNKDSRRLTVFAATDGSAKSSQTDKTIPSWARPDSDEPPPWARDEGNSSTSKPAFEIPYYAYLLASAVTAIAAIGSAFEYVNQRPVFGVVTSDSVFYAPLLGFFAFTGVPTSAFLWFRAVQIANKEADEQDRRDGYL